MAINYEKLAESNKVTLKWRNALVERIKGRSKEPEVKAIKKLLPATNFLGIVSFLKDNKKKAAAILGSEFTKDYKKMFYAAEIENELIKQYVPAVYSVLRNKKFNPMYADDLLNDLLYSLREIVWRYNRKDLQFSTYAITSLKNNYYYKMANIARKKNYVYKNPLIIIDDLNHHSSSFSGRNSEFEINDQISFHDFMKRILKEIKFTKSQKNCLIRFLGKQTYQRKTFRIVQEIIKSHLIEKDVLMPQMEEIVVA